MLIGGTNQVAQASLSEAEAKHREIQVADHITQTKETACRPRNHAILTGIQYASAAPSHEYYSNLTVLYCGLLLLGDSSQIKLLQYSLQTLYLSQD